MARNYSLAEAVNIIVKGKDMEAIADIGRRYPILAIKIAGLASIAGEQFNEFMSYIPEHISANKVNSIIKIKKDVEGSDVADTPNEAEEKSVKNATKKEAVEDANANDGTDYDSMSGKELWDLLGKKGLRNKCKEKYGTKKADLIKFLKELDADGEDTDGDVEDDDAAEANDYSKMTAPELFKWCKKRGIKAEMKKPAKYYIALLKKDDDKAKDNSDDDEWDEDAEEEKKPVKKQEKATEKKAAKKETAKDDDDDDDNDDEDWDI